MQRKTNSLTQPKTGTRNSKSGRMHWKSMRKSKSQKRTTIMSKRVSWTVTETWWTGKSFRVRLKKCGTIFYKLKIKTTRIRLNRSFNPMLMTLRTQRGIWVSGRILRSTQSISRTIGFTNAVSSVQFWVFSNVTGREHKRRLKWLVMHCHRRSRVYWASPTIVHTSRSKNCSSWKN
jgi:hypothetical protein